MPNSDVTTKSLPGRAERRAPQWNGERSGVRRYIRELENLFAECNTAEKDKVTAALDYLPDAEEKRWRSVYRKLVRNSATKGESWKEFKDAILVYYPTDDETIAVSALHSLVQEHSTKRINNLDDYMNYLFDFETIIDDLDAQGMGLGKADHVVNSKNPVPSLPFRKHLPAAKVGSFKLPDPDTDPEEEDEEDDDDEEDEEEVVQSLSVRSASPEQENILPPFNTLHSALAASAPLISAQRLSSSGRSTPTNPASFISRPVHPPLYTSRQLEDTSDAPSSEQKPPTSTQPTTLPSSTSQTTDDFTMSAADLAKLQEQQNQLTTAISTLVSHLTAAKTSSSKSPVKAPEPFHGKAEDARRFLQFFTNWAGHQPQLKKDDGTRDDKEWISTALSYMHGEAGRWASRFLQQIADHDADSTKPWPFAGGKWANFLTEFKQRFQPANDAQAALQELEQLTLGRGTVADFASRFVDIFSRTNLSDSDGMARFKRKLSQEHLLWLALSNLIKEPANLEELVAQAIKNEFVMRNMNPNSSRTSLAQYAPAPTPAPARDPYAMEIDATRPGPSGKTYQDFLNAMRGRCFGCGSTGHNKKDGNHGALRCNYCQRMGHAATVCQDKYMGFPPGRGLSRLPRRRVAATQEAPFSLFDEPAPAATATVAATTPATPSAPAPSLASLSATQQQQLDILAQLQRLHQGF
ncbi:hypothetical protein CC2G_006182 [Coprinopsis cinerea AmutBmut pab1-1]|nr:hypothetical protein CC2G_006182 [Coprinopsis cinerea AmutBmut pab1-1]